MQQKKIAGSPWLLCVVGYWDL